MPDTNYDYLKPVLGDDLFAQFAEKMTHAQGVKLANVGDGSYIPKAKYDEKVNDLTTQLAAAQTAGSEQLNQTIAQLRADLAARDKTIADGKKSALILSDLRRIGVKDPELVIRLLDVDKVSEQDGKLTGLDEQVNPMKTAQPYLFGNLPGGRGGVDSQGGAGSGGGGLNQKINDAIRSASGRSA